MKRVLIAFLLLVSLSMASYYDFSCHTDKVQYHKTFCDLQPVADKIYVGRIVSVDSLSSEKNFLDYTLENFPYTDSIYRVFQEKYENSETVHLKLKIDLEKEYSQGGWKKAAGKRTIIASEIHGWVWNLILNPIREPVLTPDKINYYHPMDWNDSSRVFFVKKTAHGDSLLGISKNLKDKDSAPTECIRQQPDDVLWIGQVMECGVPTKDMDDSARGKYEACTKKYENGPTNIYKSMSDGCYEVLEDWRYCDSYDPYDISEDEFYKTEGTFVYGKVVAVSVRADSSQSTNVTEKLQRMTTPKNPDKQIYGEAAQTQMKYEVTYQVEVSARFNEKWEKIEPKMMELHSLQERGFQWNGGLSLWKNEIDSLDHNYHVFIIAPRFCSHGSSSTLLYVSKPEKQLPKIGHTFHYAKDLQRSCMLKLKEAARFSLTDYIAKADSMEVISCLEESPSPMIEEPETKDTTTPLVFKKLSIRKSVPDKNLKVFTTFASHDKKDLDDFAEATQFAEMERCPTGFCGIRFDKQWTAYYVKLYKNGQAIDSTNIYATTSNQGYIKNGAIYFFSDKTKLKRFFDSRHIAKMPWGCWPRGSLKPLKKKNRGILPPSKE